MTGIFISYRRSASKHLARLIFNELRQRGHEVFLDVTTLDNGAFDRIILNQIAARPHFLLILSPGSLERCVNEGDWLRREIEEAFRLQRNVIPIFDEGFNIDHEKQYLPAAIQAELSHLNAPPYSHYYFDAFIETISNRFLKVPVYQVKVTEPPASDLVEVQRRIQQAAGLTQTSTLISSEALLPAPFEWIEIPKGYVTLVNNWDSDRYVYLKQGQERQFEVPAFRMAKYPLTNGQYAKFIEADGYNHPEWWTVGGWQIKEAKNWTEPLYWLNDKWNGADYPVIGVSWYEAVAFCLWLSVASGEKIMLPTEQQWQRAAQGNDGRVYPWGKNWDGNRCNHGIWDTRIKKTTPVRQYENLGDSPFGVVDMAGNVKEWCVTDYYDGTSDINADLYRDQRGGSWDTAYNVDLRVACRNKASAYSRGTDGGFRLARI